MPENRQPMNVKEDWVLHDTILISEYFEKNPAQPGWFDSFASLAAASKLAFFNVRNRASELPWNNQDARDVTPYAFVLESIGVAFFAPTTTGIVRGDMTDKYDNTSYHAFVTDVPRHLALELKVQQDIRLKLNTMMCPPGYGVSGDGYGQGYNLDSAGLPLLQNHADNFCQGQPVWDSRWVWPTTIGIPRRANLSVDIYLNEYIREVLGDMNNGEMIIPNVDGGSTQLQPLCGIQVTLKGKREVQQRGEYHK